MFDTNFWGSVYGTLTALKHFREQGNPGALIYTGSFFGDRATPVQSTYSASKHALHGFADSLPMELEAEKSPISITMIHPSRTQQSSTRPSPSPEESALYKAGFGMHERGTHEGRIRSRSYYVKATKHPVVTALAVEGLVLGIGALLKNRT